ncbi:hypothetical protein HPB48_019046 [Haemaphysalis longicornis]|uniref:Uncharacterized protein n=1 Tax=Haemaphysalis longicornis TaxID=44386 RepID=A0A9J6G3U1_HAELO|nr:hypothetical protein HPB48_019046 [Haemaphysalis longicornis]
MSDTCQNCNDKINDSDLWLMCCECRRYYHAGACSGVTKNACKKKSATAKKSWACATCKSTIHAGSRSEGQFTGSETNFASELAEIHRKLNELLTIKSKVDALQKIEKTVENIEESVKVMSNKYDEVIAKLKHQSDDISNLKKRVVKLEAEAREKEVDKLKFEVNELDQYSRRLNLEVHGLPQHTNENLLEKLKKLACDLELPPLSERDIEAAHRMPSKNEKKSDKHDVVFVRFSSRFTKERWLEKKSELRKAKTDIFFNKNLTAYNKALFWKMKSKATEKEYEFTWHKNGKSFLCVAPHVIK